MNVLFTVLWMWQAAPAPAASQARAQIAQQIRAAGENLDLGDTNEAIVGLGRALNQVRQAQLAHDPIAANVEALLGATLALAGKPNDAVAHFRAALRINAHVKVEERFWKPPVQAAFEQARGQVAPPVAAASPPSAEPKTAAPPPPKPAAAGPPPEDDNTPVTGIRARAMVAAEAGRALPIQAKVGADVGTPAKVMLFYRATGGNKFTEVVMSPNGEGYKAAIPAGEVKLPALQYYVEARDAKNRPLARRGNPDRPLAMPVGEPEAPPPPPVAKKAKKAAPAPEVAPTATPPAKAKKKAGEDEENPFDEEHDPTKVVPKAPTK
jgi:hypothetical protein